MPGTCRKAGDALPHLSHAQSGALPRIASGFIVPMCPLYPFHIFSPTFDIFLVYQKGPFRISLLTYVTSSSNSHVFPKEMNRVGWALSLCHSQCHCSCSMIEKLVLMLAVLTKLVIYKKTTLAILQDFWSKW